MNLSSLLIFFVIYLCTSCNYVFQNTQSFNSANFLSKSKKNPANEIPENGVGFSKVALIICDSEEKNGIKSSYLARSVASTFISEHIKKAFSVNPIYKTNEFHDSMFNSLHQALLNFDIIRRDFIQMKLEANAKLITETHQISMIAAFLENTVNGPELKIGKIGNDHIIVFRKTLVESSETKFYYKLYYTSKRETKDYPNQATLDNINDKKKLFVSRSLKLQQDDVIILGSRGIFSNLHIGLLARSLNFIFHNAGKNEKDIRTQLFEMSNLYLQEIMNGFHDEKIDNDVLIKIGKRIEKEKKNALSKAMLKFEFDKSEKIKALEKKMNQNIENNKPGFFSFFNCGKNDEPLNQIEMQEIEKLNNQIFEMPDQPALYPKLEEVKNAEHDNFMSFYPIFTNESVKKFIDNEVLAQEEFAKRLKNGNGMSNSRQSNRNQVINKFDSTSEFTDLDILKTKKKHKNQEKKIDCSTMSLLSYKRPGRHYDNNLSECLDRLIQNEFNSKEENFSKKGKKFSTELFSKYMVNISQKISQIEGYPSPAYLDCVAATLKPEKCNLKGDSHDFSIITTKIVEEDFTSQEQTTAILSADKEKKDAIEELKNELLSRIEKISDVKLNLVI